jgi:hypothetical protein
MSGIGCSRCSQQVFCLVRIPEELAFLHKRKKTATWTSSIKGEGAKTSFTSPRQKSNVDRLSRRPAGSSTGAFLMCGGLQPKSAS